MKTYRINLIGRTGYINLDSIAIIIKDEASGNAIIMLTSGAEVATNEDYNELLHNLEILPEGIDE